MARTTLKPLSSYPTVAGVVYALKNDAILDKKIVLALRQQGEWQALKIALGTTARRHRYVALCLYFLKTKYRWLPPLSWMLQFCKMIGPSSAWFEYLQQSQTRPSLLTATTIVGSLASPQSILDVGSGIGQLPQQFPLRRNTSWTCVDKNFFSLLIAQLYHARSDIQYVCADLEIQRLFPPQSFSTAICIDSFDFIYQKDVFIENVAQLLKKPGQFIMINLHEEQPGSELWGYGIDHQLLLKLLKKFFSRIIWHDMNDPQQSARTSFSKLDSLRYSFVAEK